MLNGIKRKLNSQKIRRLTDVHNVPLYIFAIIVLAITWSGIKTAQTNYDLEKKISTLKQQNAVLQLQNDNTSLQDKYFQTDQYLDLAARQDLGLAAPGEQVMLVSKSTALKYVDQSLVPAGSSNATSGVASQSKYIKNLEDWRDFLLGRKLLSD